MRAEILSAMVALLAVAAPAASQAELQDENILLPLPERFRPGFTADRNGMKMVEYVPAAETVDDWSEMVTEQIFYGRGHGDPDALPTGMTSGWTSACPGSVVGRAVKTQENGYQVSIWTFLCPANPATGKPETMFMKVISGEDSLYSVQYAYRAAFSKEMVAPTMNYLRRVLVCDKRGSSHPCPSGT